MSHYKTLGLDKSCSNEDIKKAYRKLALQKHPDKGGSDADFQKINDAYAAIGTPEERRKYDNPFEAGNDSMFGFFNSMNRGMGPMGPMGPMGNMNVHMNNFTKKQKTPDVKYDITLSLQEMYSGRVRKLAISRTTKCVECDGEGGMGKTKEQCPACNGKGVRAIHRGATVMRSVCMKCSGTGENITFVKICKTCNATKMTRDRTVVEVIIPEGCPIGSKIVMKGKGNYNPGKDIGDIIIVTRQKNHPIFKRVGGNLRFTLDITLPESLCGFTKEIEHLDGRKIKITSDKIVRQGDKISIGGEGIPRGKGFLEAIVNVKYPDGEFSENEKETLKSIFDKKIYK